MKYITNIFLNSCYYLPYVRNSSERKIIIMIKRYISNINKSLIELILILTFTAISITAPCSLIQAASEYDITIDGVNPVIADNANLLSDYEEITILNMVDELKEQTGFQYIFITSELTDSFSKERELEYIYNHTKGDIRAPGTILFLVASNGTDTEYALQAYGESKNTYSHPICHDIELVLGESDFTDYITVFEDLFSHMKNVDSGNYTVTHKQESTNNNIPVIILSLLASMITATGIVSALAFKKRYSYNNVCLNATATNILESKITYLRTTSNNYKL